MFCSPRWPLRPSWLPCESTLPPRWCRRELELTTARNQLLRICYLGMHCRPPQSPRGEAPSMHRRVPRRRRRGGADPLHRLVVRGRAAKVFPRHGRGRGPAASLYEAELGHLCRPDGQGQYDGQRERGGERCDVLAAGLAGASGVVLRLQPPLVLWLSGHAYPIV